MAEQTTPPLPTGYLLSDDLLFTSRIVGTGQTQGLQVRPARSVDGLQHLVRQELPACVIIDLAHPGLQLADLADWLRASCPVMPRLVAYGSHVDTAALRAAREAGCDPVLPRSKFVEELPLKLGEWMGATGPATG